MRIGLFDPYLDDIGGGERYMATIASCLSKSHDVNFFWDNPEDLKKIGERFGLNLKNVGISPNIFSFTSSKKISESKKFDRIIVLSDGSVPFLLSKKLYLHIQQPIPGLNISVKDRLKAKRVEKIIVNSEFTKSFVDNAFHVNSTLLYPPVSIYGINKNKENIILHVGRFRVLNVKNHDYKKQQVMIDAFKEMVDKGLKDWKFILGVSLTDEKEERFVDMLKSAKGYPIEFLINKNMKDLWEKGSKAKIYWHATGFGEDLEKHPEFSEHFGISTVEAMGVGAVPVVINAGGQKEIVKEGENGFLWNSLEELKSKTLRLIEDPVLLSRLSEKAYETSQRFSEEKFCGQVAKLINA